MQAEACVWACTQWYLILKDDSVAAAAARYYAVNR